MHPPHPPLRGTFSSRRRLFARFGRDDYNAIIIYPGVAQLGSEATAARGGVKGAERVAAVGRCQGAPPTQADAGHRNRKRACFGRDDYNAIIIYPGVAQLVARLLWEQDAAGSSPVTSTK